MAADLPNELFTEIQRRFRKAPVLLVGSGFSCGYGLPGMGALAEHLVNTVDEALATDEAKMLGHRQLMRSRTTWKRVLTIFLWVLPVGPKSFQPYAARLPA